MSLPRRLTPGVLAVVGLATLAPAAGATSTTPTASAATPPVYGSVTVNRARARQAAAALLARLPTPPGAVVSPTEPAGDGRQLATAPVDQTLSDVADDAAWATTTMTPRAVVAYVRAHLPAGARPSGTLTGSRERWATWTLPATPGLNGRTLAVTAVSLAGGSTGVRLDGIATWTIPRPSWERVPSSVTDATVGVQGVMLGGPPLALGRTTLTRGSAPTPVGAGLARRLAAFVNRLPARQPMLPLPCPAQFVQETVTLTFTGPTGATLARAVERPFECPSGTNVALSVGGRRGSALADSAGPPRDTSLSEELLRLHALPRCRASALDPRAAAPVRSGASQTLTLSVTDHDATGCARDAVPRVSLIGADGRPAGLRQHDQGGAGPGVILFGGETATTTLSYRWCPRARARARVARLALSGAGAVAVALDTRPAARPCRGSRLTVGAFVAAPGLPLR